MAADLADVVAYLCKNYPHKSELSKARLTKLVYLADWRSAIEHESQITKIGWVFNNYGPYVTDVETLARTDARFGVTSGVNAYGSPKDVISLRVDFYPHVTSIDDRRVLDFVIENTNVLTYESFIRLVYSTYPILTSPKGATLDLVDLAKAYRHARPLLDKPLR